MKLDFNISEFVIRGAIVPSYIADKILHYHILPMQKVRDIIDIPIFASQRSGYRPVSWELSRGRKGNSQHTFKGKGAVDWTCKNFVENQYEFLKLIIEYTDYKRIAVYKSFIHCDYKETKNGKRQLYKSGADSKWVLIKNIN